jgi:hypothetical protein
MEIKMVAANGIHSNGNGFLNCSSDYPAIDITPLPATPRPKWRDQHPLYVEHIEWVDHEGISHGLTLRSDDLQSLLADLRLVKSMIRQAKKQASDRTPQQAVPEPDSDLPPCRIHGVPMERRTSKRTGGIYFSHRLPGSKELCFGREPKA